MHRPRDNTNSSRSQLIQPRQESLCRRRATAETRARSAERVIKLPAPRPVPPRRRPLPGRNYRSRALGRRASAVTVGARRIETAARRPDDYPRRGCANGPGCDPLPPDSPFFRAAFERSPGNENRASIRRANGHSGADRCPRAPPRERESFGCTEQRALMGFGLAARVGEAVVCCVGLGDSGLTCPRVLENV